MDSDSPFNAPVPKRRGRPRKQRGAPSTENGSAASGDAAPTDMTEALVPNISAQRPAFDVETLKLSQEVVAKNYAETVAAERVPEGFSRTVLARIVSWYATPYEWREPKTEIDLAIELGLTPLALRVRASMFRDGIEQAQSEIRRNAQSHARLRYIEALDGQLDAAAAGSAPAFDRARLEAWGDEIAPLVGGATINVNVAAVREELMEKLG